MESKARFFRGSFVWMSWRVDGGDVIFRLEQGRIKYSMLQETWTSGQNNRHKSIENSFWKLLWIELQHFFIHMFEICFSLWETWCIVSSWNFSQQPDSGLMLSFCILPVFLSKTSITTVGFVEFEQHLHPSPNGFDFFLFYKRHIQIYNV